MNTNIETHKDAEVRAPGFSHLTPNVCETRAGRIKRKELGTFRKGTSTRYEARSFRKHKPADIQELIGFLPQRVSPVHRFIDTPS